MLSHIPGTASVARAWSSYVDSIVGNKISEFFKTHIHMGSGGTFSDYPDFFAFSVTLVLTGRFILFPIKVTNSVITHLVLQIDFHISFSLILVILAVGVKESSIVNNIFTGVNLLVVAYVVICGLFKIDLDNWKIPSKEVCIWSFFSMQIDTCAH